MWVECLCPVLLWFDCCARAYWSQLGKCMSCQMSVRSTWHLTSHFFGNLLVCFSLQLGAQWGKRWGNDRNAVTFVLSESCSPRGALRGLHPQLNKTERYWEILRACHVKLQNRTYTCKFFNRWNFQFELFCRICQNSKRIQAKRTHTHIVWKWASVWKDSFCHRFHFRFGVQKLIQLPWRCALLWQIGPMRCTCHRL